jgi:hypothetical protein
LQNKVVVTESVCQSQVTAAVNLMETGYVLPFGHLSPIELNVIISQSIAQVLKALWDVDHKYWFLRS